MADPVVKAPHWAITGTDGSRVEFADTYTQAEIEAEARALEIADGIDREYFFVGETYASEPTITATSRRISDALLYEFGGVPAVVEARLQGSATPLPVNWVLEFPTVGDIVELFDAAGVKIGQVTV